MRAMLEQISMAIHNVRSWRYFRLNMVVSAGLLIGGCATDDAEVNESDLCYERYIEEFSDQYPLETLKKTAALKCYS